MDERAVMMGFNQWLASVTERIHQTMHYQFDGKAEACLPPCMLFQLEGKSSVRSLRYMKVQPSDGQRSFWGQRAMEGPCPKVTEYINIEQEVWAKEGL